MLYVHNIIFIPKQITFLFIKWNKSDPFTKFYKNENMLENSGRAFLLPTSPVSFLAFLLCSPVTVPDNENVKSSLCPSFKQHHCTQKAKRNQQVSGRTRLHHSVSCCSFQQSSSLAQCQDSIFLFFSAFYRYSFKSQNSCFCFFESFSNAASATPSCMIARFSPTYHFHHEASVLLYSCILSES